jgi:hypothetical protein
MRRYIMTVTHVTYEGLEFCANLLVVIIFNWTSSTNAHLSLDQVINGDGIHGSQFEHPEYFYFVAMAFVVYFTLQARCIPARGVLVWARCACGRCGRNQKCLCPPKYTHVSDACIVRATHRCCPEACTAPGVSASQGWNREIGEMTRENICTYLSSTKNIAEIIQLLAQTSLVTLAWLRDYINLTNRAEIPFAPVLQLIGVYSLFCRVVYFLHGSIPMSKLTHMFFVILEDIVPMLVLLSITVVLFFFSLIVVLQPEGDTQWVMWHAIDVSLYTWAKGPEYWTGLISKSSDPAPVQSSVVAFLLELTYNYNMFLIQIVMLNMLIAIMGESYARVSSKAHFIALYERAKIIIDHEHGAIACKMPRRHRNKSLTAIAALVQAGKAEVDLLEIFPRWLHALEPVAHLRADDEKATQEALHAEIATLRRQNMKMEAQLRDLSQKVEGALAERMAMQLAEIQDVKSLLLARLPEQRA